MQLWSVAPWVVMRKGLIRAGVKMRCSKRWLVGDVALVPLDARARFVSLQVWVSLRPDWKRRGALARWPDRWTVRESPAAGTEELSPAPSRTAGRIELACSSKGGEASVSRVSSRPWVAALLRRGIELPSPYRLVPVKVRLFARRDEVAELKVQVAALERRMDAFEKARVA
ncbi:MAG: hypothetical protein E6J70_00965 [Deltaproteobacteria bacterium]|nr:MAG: hypothetical protein E6J70_00965 [Deltaproteobacteria bacterium]